MKIKAKPLRRKGKPKVPGGWYIELPSFLDDLDRTELSFLTERFVRLGAPPMVAEEKARAAVQLLFNSAWEERLMKFIGRAADKWLERFGSLEGFNPEEIQKAFVPGGHTLWRGRGNILLRSMLRR